ncbi:hypothetical protein [Marinobacter salarius]|jgi:hypothetical protein|uniref:hypothetical protein n=4 Tax=Marinobacter TaxID=2742 RepID=UPI0018F19E0A|nr:hypothetical protein [Marinobacter salarius]MBJ7275331.1 hypothetical protein [Marinobacter salarius]HIO02490.1 hypothetical protein [Alphaproteobacteria bacterium]|tara:strand:+ start:1053 stop:1448 length:396 start_codon:yes stop_codon:yes gene_type:complete
MNSEQLVDIAEVLLVVSVLGGFFLLVLILTFLFPKIAEVESRIATPGKQLDGIREIWGNGPIGRWMRVVHVYFFFIFRNLPRIGPRIESRMGDEAEALPMGLKLWVILPVSVFFVSIIVSLMAAWYLGVFD